MKKAKYTCIAIATLLALSSCREDVVPGGDVDLGENRVITLQALLPEVSESRGEEAGSENGIDHVQVTAYNLEESDTEPYLENERFRKRSDGQYYPIKVINCLWPETTGDMEFYAHYPQLENFVSSGKYSIDAVSVPTEISKHFDFMTAKSKVQIPILGSESSPVALNFQHQLSRIKIQATSGESSRYTFEIAGIRIGNPVVEGKFSYSTEFSSDAQSDIQSTIGSWVLPENPKKHKVEYIFKAGDQIVSIGNEGKSIMGLGGNAMVIPASIAKWQLPADPSAVVKPYSTGQMYFSVLLRVKGTNEEGQADHIVYPYEDETKYPGMNVVYLAVDASNKVLDQVYKEIIKDENNNDRVAYYTLNIENGKDPYVLPDGAFIKEFGWAAIPVEVNWDVSKSYLYTLDYTKGIGYHDPEDPAPGTPIVEESAEVILSVALTPWEDGDDTSVKMPSSSDDTTE